MHFVTEADGPQSASPSLPYLLRTVENHLSTLQALSEDKYDDEDAILALPRRRNKSQRPLAVELAQLRFPEMTEIAATIQFERIVQHAKAIIRQKKKERAFAASQPKNNAGGRLLKIQGPWAGQGKSKYLFTPMNLDPVDLKGPTAIPMPVKIGPAEDFKPIFSFLAQDRPITDVDESQASHGLELLRKTPLVEFERGIVYEDGRLDLCKKVVGPTHIGSLMESLENNHQIRHFLLGNNAISTTGAKHIAEFLAKHPDRMETWYIAGCHVTRHGLSILVPQMIKSTTITNLWFKRNPFGPTASTLLAELVLRTKKLRTLDLETTELGDEGTRQFIDDITGTPSSLRHLYLNANGIGEKACASLGRYLADPNCALESLFISTNPIGDAGMRHLAPGIVQNKTLKRLCFASTGLTSNGVSLLAKALAESSCTLLSLDLGASQTTMVHSQKFNYLDDSCIDDLRSLIMKVSLRLLYLGRTVFSVTGLQDVRDAACKSELVHLEVHRVEVGEVKANFGMTEVYEGTTLVKSCSLELRNRMVKNQAKFFPHIKNYNDFLNSEDIRYLFNTSDVRKIDSMYRTMDKRLGLPMDEPWEENDPVWKLITDDAIIAERSFWKS